MSDLETQYQDLVKKREQIQTKVATINAKKEHQETQIKNVLEKIKELGFESPEALSAYCDEQEKGIVEAFQVLSTKFSEIETSISSFEAKQVV